MHLSLLKTTTANLLILSSICFGMRPDVQLTLKRAAYANPEGCRKLRAISKTLYNSIPQFDCLESNKKTATEIAKNNRLFKAIANQDIILTDLLLENRSPNSDRIGHTVIGYHAKIDHLMIMPQFKSFLLNPYSFADEATKELLDLKKYPHTIVNIPGIYCQPTDLLLACIVDDVRKVKNELSNPENLKKNSDIDKETIKYSLLIAIQNNNNAIISEFFDTFFKKPELIGDIEFYANFAKDNGYEKAYNALIAQKASNDMLKLQSTMTAYGNAKNVEQNEESALDSLWETGSTVIWNASNAFQSACNYWVSKPN